MLHRIDIYPAKRTYTYHKDGRVCKFHVGDLIRYEKKNKIKGNTKRDTSEDENEAKIAHDKTKNKKMKFCRVLKSGCTPYVGFRAFIY